MSVRAGDRLLSGLIGLMPVSVARARLHWQERDRLPQVGCRQLLVDVSVIVSSDARTGVQRVVRALLTQLQEQPPEGFWVRPVYAARQHGYRYASADCLRAKAWQPADDDQDVVVATGDMFLGLDLCAHLLPRHRAQLLHWKRSGVRVHIVVYDLLPLLYPHWFNRRTVKNFRRWIRTLAIFADSAICISDAVKADTAEWLHRQYGLSPAQLPLSRIPLGADIGASLPSQGMPTEFGEFLAHLPSPMVLMVGTLEPRKGYVQALDTFERLWQQGADISLVIVGKPGWKTDALQHRLRNHGELGSRLHWLSDASDQMLDGLYRAASGILVMSHAEGYGLPVAEAVHYGKTVLARDIPVFREIATNLQQVKFFSKDDPLSLSESIKMWLGEAKGWSDDARGFMPGTWKESLAGLLRAMGLRASEPRNVTASIVAGASANSALV